MAPMSKLALHIFIKKQGKNTVIFMTFNSSECFSHNYIGV